MTFLLYTLVYIFVLYNRGKWAVVGGQGNMFHSPFNTDNCTLYILGIYSQK